MMKAMRWILGALVLLTVVSAAWGYDRGHVYVNGRVQAIDSTQVTIGHHTYQLAPDCSVLIQYKAGGAFRKKPAPLSEVHVGDSVYAKKIGNEILEIEIERWSR